MNTPPTSCEARMAGLLDRLVCGELEEAARRQLLAWLEEDHGRWRLCGLAFLEAQTWSQVLGAWPADGSLERRSPIRHEHSVLSTQYPNGRRRRRFAAAFGAALAACVLVAFGLGFALHAAISAPGLASEPSQPPAAEPGRRSGTVLAAFNVQSSPGLPEAPQVHIPVAPSSPLGESRIEEIPDYVRRQWERQGYQLSLQRRYLFAKLPDGQQVVVPVEQILFNHVPPQVY